MDFKIVHKTKQPLTHNRCEIHRCSHLCVPKNKNCYSCICPLSFSIAEDGTTCIKNKTQTQTIERFSDLHQIFIVTSELGNQICTADGKNENSDSGTIIFQSSLTENIGNKKQEYHLMINILCIVTGIALSVTAFFAYRHIAKRRDSMRVFENNSYAFNVAENIDI
ncbi:low-density lipoprotein receptor-related protein 2-like protein [Leptotrombidium deliense]|uniref:Low-density lipoprotein receptor-related protein 2-like protein n=1 Tax=Leptotrombidium deliense TaxID=299467 RepID=A0A443RY10_9ACAR|nr:low-density lipoprotein receptor-related protein 2-like protein [Leptotrombidium deliense]